MDQHAVDLQNPFGLTHGGGPNVSYSSYTATADAFIAQQAWRFTNGVTTPDEFIAALQHCG
jgi:poly(3-hydroxybutyrate) depolymerase